MALTKAQMLNLNIVAAIIAAPLIQQNGLGDPKRMIEIYEGVRQELIAKRSADKD
jgi:hypothetical protein